MTITTSGVISLGPSAGLTRSVVGEFGGVVPHSFSEYYAGGALVPSGTTGVGGAPVPASGALSLSDFYGTANNYTGTVTVGYRTTSASQQFHGFESIDSLPGQPASGALTAQTLFGVTIRGIYTVRDTNNNLTTSFVLRLAGDVPNSHFSNIAFALPITNYSLNPNVGTPGTPGISAFVRSVGIDATGGPATNFQWFFTQAASWGNGSPVLITILPP